MANSDERIITPSRSWQQRLIDTAAGLTVFAWGVVGLWHQRASPSASVPLAALMSLNLLVVWLFLFRRQPIREASVRGHVSALPSVCIGPFALHQSAPFAEWPIASTALFVLGTGFAAASLATLGKSFSILPASRGLVRSGAYRIVRHPAYAGELIMTWAAVFTRWNSWSVFLAAAALLTTAVRILAEENFLCDSREYRRYVGSVRWRLLPYVW